MKATSIEAFHKLRDSGRLSKRQLEVLLFLANNGAATGQEVAKVVPNGWKRLPELRNAGAVREVGLRTCSVTGERVTTWEIVDHVDHCATTATAPDQGQLL